MRRSPFLDPDIKPGHPTVPSIPVAVGYDESGRISKIALVPAVSGTVISRCGKKYVLMPNGSQRRIE